MNSDFLVPNRFRSLDGSQTVHGYLQQPDRYREFDAFDFTPRTIARGSGLSYVAASMGDDTRSVDMRHFNRVLSFDVANQWVEVEAGVKIGVLCGHLLRHGLILSVMPGHPNISVGGCMAFDVHGKNHTRDGTFRNSVISFTLLTPSGLISDVTREDPIFDATLGGMGLTGIILSAKIALVPIAGTLCALDIFPVSGLEQGREVLLENNSSADFSYSWHDFGGRGSGHGYVISGNFCDQSGGTSGWESGIPDPRPGRAMAFLNKFSIPCATFAYGKVLNSKNGKTINLFDAVFPLSKGRIYFSLHGRRGFLEHQVVVPHDRWLPYVSRFEGLRVKHGVRFSIASLRLFDGDRKMITFTGKGVSLTFDLPNTSDGQAFLSEVDQLDCEMGAVANPSKDSRLPASVFRRQMPGLSDFLEIRERVDPDHLLSSSLSQRLEL
ncbi:MAG: FAD-binding oxidoreductase [Parvibaculales bacterium]